jgi:hypothetical protein
MLDDGVQRWEAIAPADLFAFFVRASVRGNPHSENPAPQLRDLVVTIDDCTAYQFAGGWNPKSVCSFSHSQSTNQSFLIEAALSATNVSALSTLPFKQ